MSNNFIHLSFKWNSKTSQSWDEWVRRLPSTINLFLLLLHHPIPFYQPLISLILKWHWLDARPSENSTISTFQWLPRNILHGFWPWKISILLWKTSSSTFQPFLSFTQACRSFWNWRNKGYVAFFAFLACSSSHQLRTTLSTASQLLPGLLLAGGSEPIEFGHSFEPQDTSLHLSLWLYSINGHLWALPCGAMAFSGAITA